tara:strand:- start:320 stop:559 length:240 start_codon:yes stop_codon:yes gene_type:complete
LSFLDQDLAERRCQKAVTTWLQPSIFMALLELLSQIRGRLTCTCGSVDHPIPADHGLIGVKRSSFNPEASAQGWQRLLA